MTDAQTTLRELKDLVLAFSRERDWEQFHHPKDLGVALACEVGEVLEHFRYKTNDEIRAVARRPGEPPRAVARAGRLPLAGPPPLRRLRRRPRRLAPGEGRARRR